jgi:hypothetical protein
MCDKCIELEKKLSIARIAASITDQFTIDRIKMLIEELRARKARPASLRPASVALC